VGQQGDVRGEAVARLESARERRNEHSERYDAAAQDQVAAREAWLAWIDRDY
jgi:hypothetical protein